MDTISVSQTGAGTSSLIPLDQYLTLVELVAFVTVTGTVNYTIQYTNDNVFAPGFNPATASWNNVTNLTALTANSRVNIVGSARALRILQNSGSGTTTLLVSDAGTAGTITPLGLTNAGGGGGIGTISGGTTNATGPGISFANSNGLTFGVNGNTITASVGAGAGGVAISGAGNSVSNGTVVMSNANGVSFGMAGSTITASYTVPAQLSVGNSTLGNTSGNTGLFTGRLVLVGGNNVTLSGSSNGGSATITISGANLGGAQTGISGIIVSNTTYTSGTVSFSNANGISFGSSAGQAITASYTVPTQTNQTLGVYATSNTTGQSSSSTYDARSITFRGYGILSVGNSNGSVLLSTPDPVVFTQLSVGMSTNGNTAGNTGLATGQLVLAGGNNVTLSGSTNGNSMTITVSGGAGGNFTAGISGGNTAGDTGTVSNRVVFAGGANVTLSGSTNGGSQTISIVGAAGAGNFSGGFSTQGNTAGDTGIVTGRMLLVGTNNITLSGSTNGGSMTISISGAAGAGNFSAGISGGNTAGDTGTVTGRVVFAGGANITLSGSTNGGSQTISVVGAAGGGGAALSAGTQSVSTGTVVFSNSNNISFGMSGSSRITANAALNLYALGNTTQNSTTVLGIDSVSLNGLGAMTVGYSNGSVQLSAPATSSLVGVSDIVVSTAGSTISVRGVTHSGFNPFANYAAIATNNINVDNASLMIQPQWFPNVQFDGVQIVIENSNATNSSGSHSLSFWAGIYSKNVSTLSLVASASQSTAVTHSGTGGSYSLYSNARNFVIPFTNTLSAGNYWVGLLARSSSAGADGTYNHAVVIPSASQFWGRFGSSSNASNQRTLGLGTYSASTSGIPSSVGFSEIVGTGAANVPVFALNSGTA